ncbi:hypothetical protein COO60DRAFT_1637651 [Scenedesmus sp. NREL 46B-D3]|nr:hypothetical protein COO60DRAFT_1637651 [Scenedesmus sp. NREL 46B-D3]
MQQQQQQLQRSRHAVSSKRSSSSSWWRPPGSLAASPSSSNSSSSSKRTAAAATTLGRGLCRALATPGSTSPPPIQEGDELSAATARAQTAAACVRPGGSPCASNFCSSRAAGIAAGISKPGMSLKHLAWLRGQYPGAKPPGRGDVESLRVWLQEQLQLLLGRHAPAGSSNQQRLQHDAQHVQTSQLLLAARQPQGSLDGACLQQQEALYSAAFNELCGQASVQCVERGRMLAAALAGAPRHAAGRTAGQAGRTRSEGAAHAAAAAAGAEVGRLQQQQQQQDERVALAAIGERHAAKVAAAKRVAEQSEKKTSSGAQQLVQRVLDLESTNSQQAASVASLQRQLLSSQQQAQALSGQLAAWQARGGAAEQQLDEAQQQLLVSTPRPRRELGLLADLLTAAEAALVEQAMIAGIPAEHVHRLLLGLSLDGEDVRPWLALAGCAAVALKAAAEPHQLHQQLRQLLASCEAAGLSRHLQPPGSMGTLSRAVHLGVPADTLMQLLDGGLGLTATPAQLAAAAAAGAAAATLLTLPPSRQQQQQQQDQQRVWQDAAGSGKAACAAPASALADSSNSSSNSSTNPCNTNRAVEVLAAVGIGLPYLPLVGVLAAKYGHDASELGGPVTEALQHAQLSTRARVQDLEGRAKAMHRCVAARARERAGAAADASVEQPSYSAAVQRHSTDCPRLEVVLLKRTLADARKHEAERIEAALRDQKRKIARREARQPGLLDKFLQTKWGDYFMGIGLMDEVPRALKASVPINNKRMSKRDAEKLAREIWAAKDEAEAAGAPRSHLADVTATFLERRYFAIPRLVTEVAYNFVYSLGQHSYDADCNLFLRVFTGDVDEAVRYEQQALEGGDDEDVTAGIIDVSECVMHSLQLIRLLKLLDVSINHQALAAARRRQEALAGFLKGKSVDRLSEVYGALDTDQPGDALHYPGLFCDDDDLNQGMTAEILRSQHLAELLEYLQEVEDSTRDAAEDHQTTSLTPAMLRSAWGEYHARWTLQRWTASSRVPSDPTGSTSSTGCAPARLQPALRPSAATAATAVSRIAPVGKFKQKLMQALRVGMNETASADSRRGSSSNGAASGSAAGSAGVSADSAAVAASRRRSTSNELPVRVPQAGPNSRQLSLMPTDSVLAEDSDGREQGLQLVGGLCSAAEGAGAGSAAEASIVTSSSAAVGRRSRPAPAHGVGTAAAAAAAAARNAGSGAAMVQPAMTVGMLSAMEAVRQSWLKEEEEKMMHTSAPEYDVYSGGGGGGSSRSGYGRRATFRIPDIPALKLDDLSGHGIDGWNNGSASPSKSPSVLQPQVGAVNWQQAAGAEAAAAAASRGDGGSSSKLLKEGGSSMPGSPMVGRLAAGAAAAWPSAPGGAGQLSAAASSSLRPRLASAGSRSRSSMRKQAPPALLLQDADDVCSANRNSTLAATQDQPAGSDAHADDEACGMCFTPHAPAEGGKVNALMMRKVGKGKSLKRLEEVMLMWRHTQPTMMVGP